MSIKEILSRIKAKTKSAVLQLFTPKELKAVLLFLGVGFAVLLFRGGKELFYTLYPPAKPDVLIAREAYNDSIFAALSAKIINEDSLKFSLPEDSILIKNKDYIAERKKGKDLPPHSIAINKADEDAFTKLPGVGKVTAQRILSYRSKRGGFRDVREVMNIQGIGEKKYKEMAQYLRLN
jgi:competence ComEA-like helix-hairpin-helix protein